MFRFLTAALGREERVLVLDLKALRCSSTCDTLCIVYATLAQHYPSVQLCTIDYKEQPVVLAAH